MGKGIFERNVPGSTKRLAAATIGIAGCGGIGSNTAVSLVRSGAGNLILADHDIVEESNLNRQHFFQDDIGKVKVEALACHLQAINPSIHLRKHDTRLTADNLTEIFRDADILIEAFDRAEDKHWLLERWSCTYPDRPVIGVSGIAGIGMTASIELRSSGNIHIVGDESSDPQIGLCGARVAIAAAMQANIAIALITDGKV